MRRLLAGLTVMFVAASCRTALHPGADPLDVPDGGPSTGDGGSLVIDGVSCDALPLDSPRSLDPCGVFPSESFAARCGASAPGPALSIVGHDLCQEAVASGVARVEMSSPVATSASCDGALLRSGSEIAFLRFGGSTALAEALTAWGPVQSVVARATTSAGGCVRVAEIALGDPIPTFAAYVLELPAAGGEVGLGLSPNLVPLRFRAAPDATLGAACTGGPSALCASFYDAPTAPAALLPCGDTELAAPLGGCGDRVGYVVTSGYDDCGGRIQIGFRWPLLVPLCH